RPAVGGFGEVGRPAPNGVGRPAVGGFGEVGRPAPNGVGRPAVGGFGEVGRPAPNGVGRPAPSDVRRRAAFSVTECLVALVLLGAAVALMAQLLGTAGVQRRVADQHALALQETANLMERLFALPYSELTPERAAELRLSESVRQRLPEPQLEITIKPVAGEMAAKEIRVSLRWLDRSGGHGAPAELTAWRHADRRDGS
ncbi:MAG TPA: hypothetical protein PLF81_28725, partial [Candidatus Anammoximicrobium sp.]|nr:hypothetical protein [Candidatus Anammoximicrobium sp.]